MRLNRRVPVGTHGGVRGRLSIHESLLLDLKLKRVHSCSAQQTTGYFVPYVQLQHFFVFVFPQAVHSFPCENEKQCDIIES